jgi:uncharacterized protein
MEEDDQIRPITEFFSSQGMGESIFPRESYLTPEELVDAALAGLDAG